MCRWLAYSGAPILIREMLYEGPNSLVAQSLHSRMGAEPTNGDGFGVGWYGAPDTPGVFHSTEPAWNDDNLRELAGHISSPLFFTHIRAAIGSAVQQTNCHPFRHDRWLFMHNGYINEFATIKRDLILAVDPSLYPQIQGQADTEVLFYLALTLGLEDDPPAAVEQAIGLVEAVASRHGVPHPFQGTVATTDGESIWAFRYSSERNSRSLFYTTDVPTLRKLYPGRQLFQEVSDNARLIVSEPLGDVAGVWNEVPESTYGIVGPDHAEMRPFQPKAPSTPVPVVA
jgi:predicted glutamine amidotransferase